MIQLALLIWIGSRIDAPGWYFFLLGAVIVVRFLSTIATWCGKTKNNKEES